MIRLMHAIGRWLWRLVPGNPLVVRIVGGASRRKRHLFVRMGYLGLLVGLVLLGLLSGRGLAETVSLAELAQSGSQVLRLIAYGQVIAVCLLAPLLMAGAIASEQSGKTFDILLTTPLSNLQVVLGSLLSRLFFVLALLLSGLPLFAVVLVFGGIRPASVFTAFAVAACTAVLVGAVAITLSVLRAGGRKAVFLFVIAVAGYLVAAYLLDVGLLRRLDAEPYTTWLTPLHPLLVLESSLLGGSYRPPPPEVLAGYPAPLAWFLGHPLQAFAAWTLGVSLLLVLGSSVLLRRIGQGESVWISKLRTKLRIDRGERTHPPREVTGNPIAWREAHTRGKVVSGIVTRWGYVALGLLAGAGLIVAYHYGALPNLSAPGSAAAAGGVSGGGAFSSGGGTSGGGHEVFHRALTLLIVVEVAVVTLVAVYMSAGCVSREREDGTLDIVLTTPVTAKQYVWGKLRGLVRFLAVLIAVPVLTLVAASVYVMVGRRLGWAGATFTHYVVTPGGGGASMPGRPLLLPEVGLELLLILVPFVALCVASGMAWSLKAKGVVAAVVPTVGIIGSLVLVMGLCGWSAAESMPLIGPIINAFSPPTSVAMLIDPWDRVGDFGESEAFGRTSLALAALIAAGGYGVVVYAMLIGMVRGFDQTVRKLSGTG